jgi:hypothetical protein
MNFDAIIQNLTAASLIARKAAEKATEKFGAARLTSKRGAAERAMYKARRKAMDADHELHNAYQAKYAAKEAARNAD